MYIYRKSLDFGEKLLGIQHKTQNFSRLFIDSLFEQIRHYRITTRFTQLTQAENSFLQGLFMTEGGKGGGMLTMIDTPRFQVISKFTAVAKHNK